MSDEKIACPKCEWEPHAYSRWHCACRHVWNTFDTGGVCPQCKKRWKNTQCLSCGKWSPHVDWYRSFDALLDELLAEEVLEST